MRLVAGLIALMLAVVALGGIAVYVSPDVMDSLVDPQTIRGSRQSP